MDPQNSYLQLKNSHEGKNCVILGCGPSLFFASQNKNFNKIHEHVVISVNSSIMLMPWKEGEKDKRYWVSNDHLCTRWTWWDDVVPSKSIKVVRNSWWKYRKELEGFLFFRPRPTSEDVINPDDVGLSFPSSCPSALDLSLQMGCKQIFLLGVDHSQTKGMTHFWDGFSKALRPSQNAPAQGPYQIQARTFKYNLMAYRGLLDLSRGMSANIYNANPESKVNIFPKITFDDIFRILKK